MTDFSLNSQGVFRVYIRVLGFVDLGFRAKGFKIYTYNPVVQPQPLKLELDLSSTCPDIRTQATPHLCRSVLLSLPRIVEDEGLAG